MSRFFAAQVQEDDTSAMTEDKPIEEVEEEDDKKKDKKKKKGKVEKTGDEIAAEMEKKRLEAEAKQKKLEEEKEKKRKKEEEEKEKKRLQELAKKEQEGENGEGDDDDEKDEKGGKKKKDKKKPVSQAAKLAADRMKAKKEEEERIKRLEEEQKRKEEEEERKRLEEERIRKEKEEEEARIRAEKKQELKDAGLYMTKAERKRKQAQERAREQLMYTQQSNLFSHAAWGQPALNHGKNSEEHTEKTPVASPEVKPERKQSRAEKKAEEIAHKVLEGTPKKKHSEKIEEVKQTHKPETTDNDQEDWEKLIDLEEAKKTQALLDDQKNSENQRATKTSKGKPKGHKKGGKEGDADDGKKEDHEMEAEKQVEQCPIAGGPIYHDPKKDVFNVESRFRCPIICILGHVDTGKTKILDKIRRTNVQSGEAGGITQQIGASFFPQYKLKEEIAKLDPHYKKINVEIPGLLIIDTPGHESFSNLRKRGESLCDFAILVVDVKHGLENQTIESLNMLKDKGTPFIVALNKIDIIKDWKSTPDGSSLGSYKAQSGYTQDLYDQYFNRVQKDFAEHGILIQNYWLNDEPKYNQSVVPTSAITGEGIPDLLGYITEYSQVHLEENITPKEDFNCSVMEVKKIEGLGTTIDVVLVDGTLTEGDKIVLSGFEGPIHTTVRAILTPQPLKELRVKAEYDVFTSVTSTMRLSRVRLVARSLLKDLKRRLQGLPCTSIHLMKSLKRFMISLQMILREFARW